MEVRYIKGKTGCLEAPGVCIPFYELQEKEWVLMDSGSRYQEQELLETLEQEQVTVRAVIASHAHYDHTGNFRCLKKRYGAELVMSLFDAGISQDPLTLKSTFYSSTSPEIKKHYTGMVCLADQIILPWQDRVVIGDVEFELIHLPGHTFNQFGIVTPDQVAYLADSIFSEDFLQSTPLIYALDWTNVLASMETLRKLSYPVYVLAHSGVYEELEPLLKANQMHFQMVLKRFRKLFSPEFTLEEMIVRVVSDMNISARGNMAARVAERSIRAVLEYLQETGELECKVKNGLVIYGTISKSIRITGMGA